VTLPPGDDVLDEAYERLFAYGPEFEGYLSNHGPMVVEVLERNHRSDATHAWLDRYTRRLEPASSPSSTIARDEWREVLGDVTRLGDWLSLFEAELEERPWREVLAEWWPRLLPGAVGAATHGLIRTGHALRALQVTETGSRLRELGMALGYWAARFRPLPAASQAVGDLGPTEALAHLPRIENPTGGAGTRLAEVDGMTSWPDALAVLRPPTDAPDVQAELDALVGAAVAQYLEYGRAEPIMLVHAATAPAAAAAALQSLPVDLWRLTWQATWSATAAITACYAVTGTEPGELHPFLMPEDILSRAVENGDEHVIKFTDVALLAHQRGCVAALSAASHATSLVD
jgi:hypothetical protein